MPETREEPAPAPPRGTRLSTAAAVLVAAGTFLAAEIDFARRHTPGISPARYWLPQATHIWAPGLAVGLVLAIIAWRLHRRQPSPP